MPIPFARQHGTRHSDGSTEVEGRSRIRGRRRRDSKQGSTEVRGRSRIRGRRRRQSKQASKREMAYLCMIRRLLACVVTETCRVEVCTNRTPEDVMERVTVGLTLCYVYLLADHCKHNSRYIHTSASDRADINWCFSCCSAHEAWRRALGCLWPSALPATHQATIPEKKKPGAPA